MRPLSILTQFLFRFFFLFRFCLWLYCSANRCLFVVFDFMINKISFCSHIERDCSLPNQIKFRIRRGWWRFRQVLMIIYFMDKLCLKKMIISILNVHLFPWQESRPSVELLNPESICSYKLFRSSWRRSIFLNTLTTSRACRRKKKGSTNLLILGYDLQ